MFKVVVTFTNGKREIYHSSDANANDYRLDLTNPTCGEEGVILIMLHCVESYYVTEVEEYDA